MRVLIVEDEPKMAALISRALREEGHPADVAARGEEALWMVQAAPYDAINVAAAATERVPEALVEQLAPGGRLVVPVDDAVRGQKPVAFVVAAPGATVTPGMVKDFALEHGPAYAHPRHVELVAELPLAGTGKVDRRLLIERAEALTGAGPERGESR